MSEKSAKAKRRMEGEGYSPPKDLLFTIQIHVNSSGGFEMEVPKGASVPLTLGVLMRASQKVYDTFMEILTSGPKQPNIVIPSGIPEGALRRRQ